MNWVRVAAKRGTSPIPAATCPPLERRWTDEHEEHRPAVTDALDNLLATIDALEADTDDEVDDFPWHDAARWCPTEVEWDDPFGDDLPEFLDDGAVIVCDPMRPWVVLDYTPPWWARE